MVPFSRRDTNPLERFSLVTPFEDRFSDVITRSTARHAILPSFPFLKHLITKEGLVYAEAHFYRR